MQIRVSKNNKTLNGVVKLPAQLLNKIVNALHQMKGIKLALSKNIYKKVLSDNVDDIEWLEQKFLQKLPEVNQHMNGITTEHDLVKINEQEFKKFVELIEEISLEEDLKNKVIGIVKTVCLHSDIEKISKHISEDFHFLNLNNKIKLNPEVADILREVAIAFEQSDDIQTAYKVMEKAHLLRPKGPTIKQKLEEYRQLLTDQQASE